MVTTRIAAELYISQAGVVILVTRRRLGIANAYSLSDDHALEYSEILHGDGCMTTQINT